MRSRSGQALVEMAVAMPILLMVLLGVVSYGLYINAVDTVQQATRLGARAASIGNSMGCPGDSASAQEAQGKAATVYGIVDDQINGNRWLGSSPAPTPVTYAAVVGNQSDPQQNTIEITVALPYRPVVPIPGLLPATVEIAQTYQMMVQNEQTTGGVSQNEPTGSPYDETTQWTHPTPPASGVSYLVQPGGC